MALPLTDNLFLDYLRCHRRAFLELYGNSEERDPPGDYIQKIIADSSHNRATVLSQFSYHSVRYERGDWEAGAAATLALMEQGEPVIHRGVIISTVPYDHPLVGTPDLLVRVPGRSRWGDWQYEPAQIKLGRRPKLEYQLTSTWQAWILEEVQDATPENCLLYLRDRPPFNVLWEERLFQLEEMLDDFITMALEEVEPEVFIARSRCSLCAWQSFCHDVAIEQQHLSLLPGVTPKRYSFLQELGLTTLDRLREAEPEVLANLPGFGPRVAEEMLDQAYATWSNTALAPVQVPAPPPLEAPVELYFDIEAEPDLGVLFLHGVLEVNHRRGTETFHAFVAEQPADEEQTWNDFLQFVCEVHPTAPIYHFCSYEADSMGKLGAKYGTDPAITQALVERFVDVHWWVTQLVTMPVESYALKHIARWIGFEWRDTSANGALAIFWYLAWLKEGDRSFLDQVIEYNEDDCRATYVVKEWLADFVWGVQRKEVG